MTELSKDEKNCITLFYEKAKANKEQLHGTYDNSRRFLRYFSYGCYSIDTLQILIPCSRESYYAFQKLYREILPKDRYISEKVDKKKRPALRGDAYYGNENFLAETFRVKSLRELEIFFFLHILQCLAGSTQENNFSAKEVAKKLSYLTYPFNRDQIVPDARSLSLYLSLLGDFGLVQAIPHGKRVRYALADDPLAALTTDEAEELLFAVDYFKNTAFLSVPGYFLADTLCQKFKLDAGRRQPFQFINQDIRRILDDDAAYQILCAIENHQDLHIVWQHNGKKMECDIRPQVILEDELGDGRRQLLTLPRNRRMRLEDIYELRKCDKHLHLALPKEKETENTTIFFLLHFDTEQEKTSLLQQMWEEFPQFSLHEENTSSARCSFHCVDPQKYLPLLRSFLPHIELFPQAKTFLFREMQRHIHRALAKYDEGSLPRDAQPPLPHAGQGKRKPAGSPQESMFEEVHSGIYRWLVTTYNMLCCERDMPVMQDLLDRMPYSGKLHPDLFIPYLMAAFQFNLTSFAQKKIKENPKAKLNPKDFVVVSPQTPIPILPTRLELRWLKTVLRSPETDFLLDPARKEKLLTALASVKTFDLSVWKRQLNWKDVTDRPDVYASLKALVPALRRGQNIVLRHSVYAPLRLCQNVSTGIYHLLCWDFARHEPYWMHEKEFSLCVIPAQDNTMNTHAEAEGHWKTYLDGEGQGASAKKLSVSLSFYEVCNMRERVYTAFSAFDKESHFSEKNNVYHLTVFYRPFEEEDVLRRILSFGAYVTVLEPTSVRDELLRRLRRAQELYGVDAHTTQ